MVASWACDVTEIHKEALKKPPMCEDYNDLTSPTSTHIQDIYIAVSVVYDTFFFFTHTCLYCLIVHLNCEIKLSLLLHL